MFKKKLNASKPFEYPPSGEKMSDVGGGRRVVTFKWFRLLAELGDVERVRKLVSEKGRRPDALDAHGYTPLHLAAQNGRLAVVRYLLNVGASPDGVAKDAGGCGATPLHRAAFAGQLLCVKALLAAGARPSATDSSFLDMKTPLHKAAGQGHWNVCIALLEVDADPNALDASGNTALDVLYLSCPPNTTFDLLPESRARVKRQSDEPTDGISEHHNRQGASAGWRKETSSAGLGDGEILDWDGAREAFKRYGGKHVKTTCSNAAVGAARSNSGGEGSIDPRAVAAAAAGEVAEVAEEGRNRSHVDLPLGEDRKEGCGVGRTTTEAANESDAMARSDSNSAGIPCGECRLPKVVMVRSFCCGGLLYGRLAVVRYLLDVGASPDGVAKDAGECGATPLHRAAFAGQLLCVKALLAAGARPSATDSSFLDMKTPLHKAAGQGHWNVCIALLEVDADPNALDASGNTALDVLYLSCPPNTTFDLLPKSSRGPQQRREKQAMARLWRGGGELRCLQDAP